MNSISKRIRQFDKKFKLYFKKYNLNHYKRNIKNLKIIDLSSLKNNYSRSAYIIKENKIELFDIEDLEHELLHVTSSYFDKKTHCGISIGTLGTGINEGYTQVLTERYFNKTNFTYPVEKQMALCIEQIIGKNLMEKIYFNASYDEFVIELCKYASRDEIIYYLNVIDLINEQLENQIYVEEIYLNIKDVNLFLLECFINKKVIELNLGQITRKEVYNEIKKYIKFLNSSGLNLFDKDFFENSVIKVLQI